jgi:hypothetical protein
MHDADRQSPDRRRVLLGVVPAMLLPFVASLVYFILLTESRLTQVLYSATKVFTLLWPAAALWWIEKRPLRTRHVTLREHLRAVPLGAGSGLVIAGVIVGAYALTPLGDYVRGFADTVRERTERLGVVDHYVLFGLFLAIAHSLIEEYYWRWYVFGRLVTVVPRGVAYGLASLAFAAHHYVILGCYFSPPGMILFGTCVGIGGAFWCWLFRRQNTLLGSWISHALVDAAILGVGHQLLFR